MDLIDLTGQKFGKWTVLKRVADKGKNRRWLCKCECGTVRIVGGRHLTSKTSQSCGCVLRKGENHPGFKHGDSQHKSRLYKIWCEMKARCSCHSNSSYKRYGERNISVCPEWIDDYTAFKHWALSNGYSPELSIDRINNDGNYEPSNCRWATPTVQANNRRSTRKIEYQGIIDSLKGHCQRLHVNYNSVKTRLSRDWTFEEAISGQRNKEAYTS
jgi:hypothetical protein